jgi:hypothetical protein
MVGKASAEVSPGSSQRIMEHVVRIVHLIHPVDGLETAFVKAAVMSHQRKVSYEMSSFPPHLGEYRSVLSVILAKAVYAHAEPLVVVRFRMDKAVEGIRDKTLTYNHETDAANA